MKISGRFVIITDTKFVPDRLVIYEGEAITFKLEVKQEIDPESDVYQVFLCLTYVERNVHSSGIFHE